MSLPQHLITTAITLGLYDKFLLAIRNACNLRIRLLRKNKTLPPQMAI